MSFWDTLKEGAQKAGTAASIATQKTKLRTDILLIDRQIKSRQQKFGVELYSHACTLTENTEFYASDDLLTSSLRPPLLTAQREIAALEKKRMKRKEEMNEADARRVATLNAPALEWHDKIRKAGKSTAIAGTEGKLKMELVIMEREMKRYKQLFGVELYETFEMLEDTKDWLPTDRHIRSVYDHCRKDIEELQARKAEKLKELNVLAGVSAFSSSGGIGRYDTRGRSLNNGSSSTGFGGGAAGGGGGFRNNSQYATGIGGGAAGSGGGGLSTMTTTNESMKVQVTDPIFLGTQATSNGASNGINGNSRNNNSSSSSHSMDSNNSSNLPAGFSHPWEVQPTSSRSGGGGGGGGGNSTSVRSFLPPPPFSDDPHHYR